MAQPGLHLLFVLLLGALCAGDSPSIKGSPWKPRIEYDYELNARSFAGFSSLQGQYSGVRYGGRLRVQGLTADTAIVRMEKMWWAPLHARMLSDWWSVLPLQNHTLPGNADTQEELRLSGSSAVVRFQNGAVQSFLVSKAAADWEVNMLQGIVGQMQMQSASKSINNVHGHNLHQTEKDVFRTLESSVSGRCEVLYEITPTNPPAEVGPAEAKMCAGKPYIQITKTRNYTSCENIAEETRGLPKCTHAGNSCGSFWARASISQLIGCGSEENFQLVQSVSSGSVRAELQLREDSLAAEVNSFNLTLSHVTPVHDRLPTPKDGTLIRGLGYRVNGKQVSSGDSSSDESEESDESESVEVVSHKQKHKNDPESNSRSDGQSNEKPRYKKHSKNDNSNESGNTMFGKHGKKSHKKESADSSVSESNESGRHGKKSHRNDDDSSNESDSDGSRKHGKANHKVSRHNMSLDSEESNRKGGKQKLHRHRRSNRENQQNRGDEEFESDIFAGALSPINVQGNSSLLSHVQHRLVELIQDAAVEIARPEGPNSLTMERLSMAVRLARSLTASQLHKIQEQLKNNEDQWILFRDVVYTTGSDAGVQVGLDWIRDRKVPSIIAQQTLSSLASRVPKPTGFIIKQVQAVYNSAKGEDEELVRIAAALALGELAGRSRSSSSAIASFLAEQLKEHGDKPSMRVGLMWALGATASPKAIQPLLQMAKNTRLTAYQRSQAVLAVRACAMKFPGQVLYSLLAMYHSPLAPVPVRLAAVSVLVYTRPSLPIWQRLAVSTFYEPNPAVASYVWSTIYTFAKLQDPMYSYVSKMARLALPLARRAPEGLHLAFNKVAASVDVELERLAHEHSSYFNPVDGANIYYRRVTQSGGERFVDSEVDAWMANPDDLLQATLKSVFGWKDNRQMDRPPQKDVPHSTKMIHDRLNIVARHLPDPQGHLRMTLMPFMKNMFIPFDKNTPSQFAKTAGRWFEEARSGSGKTLKMQQMGGKEISIATISEMGFPINLRLHAPWVMRSSGKVHVQRNNSVEADINFLLASGLSAQLSIMPSWASREYVAGIRAHAIVSTPAMSLRAHINNNEGRMWMSGVAQEGLQGEGAARIVAQPYTASLELTQAELTSQAAAIHNATNARASLQHMVLTSWDSLSVSMRAPVKPAALPAWIRESRPVLGFPLLGPALTASRLDVMLARPAPFNVSFSLVKAMSQSGDVRVVYPDVLKWNEAENDAPIPVPSTTSELPPTDEPSTTPQSTYSPSEPIQVPIRPARSLKPSNGSLYVDSGNIDLSVEGLNATNMDPYNSLVNGSSELFILSRALEGMDGRAYVVGVNMTIESQAQSPASTYSAFWTFGSSLASKLARAGMFARNNQDYSQVAVTAAFLAEVLPAVSVENAINSSPDMLMKADFMKTDSGSAKAVVSAYMDSSRSIPKNRRLWTMAQEQGCINKDSSVSSFPVCMAVLLSAVTPDQFNMTLNFNDVAQANYEPIVDFAWQSVKSQLWTKGNIAVNSAAEGVSNEVRIGVTAQPDGSVDGFVKTPRTLTEVTGAAIPTSINFMYSASPKRSMCAVTPRKLLTLDGMQADMVLSDCWHLIAKDCSGKNRFAVLARTKPGNSSALEVEVNIDNYQIVRLLPEGAWLNGVPTSDLYSSQPAQVGSPVAVEVRDRADTRVMRIVRARDGAQVVDLPDHGMTVYYGNSSVLVQAGVSLRGRLCGLCGNYDGSKYGEWRNPQNKIEKSAQAFTNSYKVDCNNAHH